MLQSNGSFTYIPAGGFFGSDEFTYRTSDGKVASQVATAVIDVHPVALPPGDEPAVEPPVESGTPARDTSEAEDDDDEFPDVELLASQQSKIETNDRAESFRSPIRIVNQVATTEVFVAPSVLTPTEAESDFFTTQIDVHGRQRSFVAIIPKTVSGSVNDSRLLFDFDAAMLLDQLDDMKDQLKVDLSIPEWAAGTALFSSFGMSAGYILWSLRGGYLLASLVSSMPAWTLVDPLPVLEYLHDEEGENADGESLESILEKSN